MVGDVNQITISGLADTEFLDKTDGLKRKRQQESVLSLTGETDRPYLDTEASIDLDDPILKRRITVEKVNSKTTVVWNPWSELTAKLADMSPDGWLRMTCIESANALNNAVILSPGDRHTMHARVIVKEFEEEH
jgi:glucose-6-phosphate 1-epimerase